MLARSFRRSAWAGNASSSARAAAGSKASRSLVRKLVFRTMVICMPCLKWPQWADEEAVQPTRLAGIGEGPGTRVGDTGVGHPGRGHAVVGADVVGADQAGDAHQLVAGVQGQPLLAKIGRASCRERV